MSVSVFNRVKEFETTDVLLVCKANGCKFCSIVRNLPTLMFMKSPHQFIRVGSGRVGSGPKSDLCPTLRCTRQKGIHEVKCI